MRRTYQKLIISGPIFEWFTFHDKPIFYGQGRNKGSLRIGSKEPTEKIADTSIYRAKSQIRRLISANAWQWGNDDNRIYLPMFLTLTFKENIQDLNITHKIFMKYIQRLNYFVNNKKITTLKYVAVTEFQKRGAIHYHIIFFNLPYIERMRLLKLNKVWGFGFYNLEPVYNEKKMSNYISKYMYKNINNKVFFGRKKYLSSRRLKKLNVVLDEIHIGKIISLLPPESKKMDEERKSEYTGNYNYKLFNLGQGKTIYNLLT
jgi:hypothetical protein